LKQLQPSVFTLSVFHRDGTPTLYSTLGADPLDFTEHLSLKTKTVSQGP
jgi:hypothetical protein